MYVSFWNNGMTQFEGNYIQLTGSTLVELLNYPKKKLDKFISILNSLLALNESDSPDDVKREILSKANKCLIDVPFYKCSTDNLFESFIPDEKIIYGKCIVHICYDNIDIIKHDLLGSILEYHRLLDNIYQQYRNVNIDNILKYLSSANKEWNEEFLNKNATMDMSNIKFREMFSFISKRYSNKSDDYFTEKLSENEIIPTNVPEDRQLTNYNVVEHEGKYTIQKSEDIFRIGTFLYMEFFEMLQFGNYIKKCKNCGKYFLVTSGHDVEYCDNTLEGETRPCSEIGAVRSYVQKVKGDPLLALYNRAYKTHYARRKKTTGAKKMTADEFMNWCNDAKSKLGDAQSGKISLVDFSQWLKI